MKAVQVRIRGKKRWNLFLEQLEIKCQVLLVFHTQVLMFGRLPIVLKTLSIDSQQIQNCSRITDRVYSELCQTSKMEFLVEIVNGF